MNWRVRPVISRLWQRLLARQLPDEAESIEQWASATTRIEQAAISFPNEIDRSIGFAPGRTRQAIALNMTERQVYHPATLAYRLNDALIVDGCLYTRRYCKPLCAAPRRSFIPGNYLRRKSGLLCTDCTISQYFGDWLMCGMALELLAKKKRLEKIIVPTKSWSNADGYRQLLDLPKPEVPPLSQAVRFDTLWYVDDRAMNQDRVNRFAELRRHARTAAGTGPERVYLDRGETGVSRGQIDENAVRATLVEQGFVIAQPEKMEVRELASMLGAARICVGVEGSALTHATQFMPSGGAIVAIQPPRRFADSIKLFADACQLRFGFVVGDDLGEQFRVDPDRLIATLDLVAREIA